MADSDLPCTDIVMAIRAYYGDATVPKPLYVADAIALQQLSYSDVGNRPVIVIDMPAGGYAHTTAVYVQDGTCDADHALRCIGYSVHDVSMRFTATMVRRDSSSDEEVSHTDVDVMSNWATTDDRATGGTRQVSTESTALFYRGFLYDETLRSIDPYDRTLTPDQIRRFVAECRRNIGYFLRAVIRIPKPGSVSSVEQIPHDTGHIPLGEQEETPPAPGRAPVITDQITIPNLKALHALSFEAANEKLILVVYPETSTGPVWYIQRGTSLDDRTFEIFWRLP